jgi:isoaspartyl peptidase/L-asparaginase-like protein (Ntn-hydrolase superfamily)
MHANHASHAHNKRKLEQADNKTEEPVAALLLVVIHLGAGYFSPSNHAKLNQLTKLATSQGFQYYDDNKSVISDANELLLRSCSAAISILEQSELTNAGIGSVLNENGAVECDSSCSISCMDHSARFPTIFSNFGACSLISDCPTPSQIATETNLYRLYQTRDKFGRIKPLLLCGAGAIELAKSRQFHYKPTDLATASNKAKFDHFKQIISLKERAEKEQFNLDSLENNLNNSTVGAIVLDSRGFVASAVSSGGVWLKFPGRIGHAAHFAAGCHTTIMQRSLTSQNIALHRPEQPQAQHSGAEHRQHWVSSAASVSGVGEEIIQNSLAQRLCVDLAQNSAEQGKNNSSGSSDFLSSHEILRRSFTNSAVSGQNFAKPSLLIEGGAIVILAEFSANQREISAELFAGHSTQHFGYGYAVNSALQLSERAENVARISVNSSTKGDVVATEGFRFKFAV